MHHSRRKMVLLHPSAGTSAMCSCCLFEIIWFINLAKAIPHPKEVIVFWGLKSCTDSQKIQMSDNIKGEDLLSEEADKLVQLNVKLFLKLFGIIWLRFGEKL